MIPINSYDGMLVSRNAIYLIKPKIVRGWASIFGGHCVWIQNQNKLDDNETFLHKIAHLRTEKLQKENARASLFSQSKRLNLKSVVVVWYIW